MIKTFNSKLQVTVQVSQPFLVFITLKWDFSPRKSHNKHGTVNTIAWNFKRNFKEMFACCENLCGNHTACVSGGQGVSDIALCNGGTNWSQTGQGKRPKTTSPTDGPQHWGERVDRRGVIHTYGMRRSGEKGGTCY